MHRIRLVGPWQIHGGSSEGSESWIDIVLPHTPVPSGGRMNSRAKRKFHAPTGIDASTPLRIAVTGTGIVGAQLNGIALFAQRLPSDSEAATETVSFDITDQLKPFNELEIELRSSKERCAMLQSAELQIGG